MSLSAEARRTAKVEQPWVLRNLPSYRPVARKLMMLTSLEDVPLSKVQDVLRTDAAFTADVLRLANSPLIGLRAPVTSVLHAVMVLGLERMKSLATTLALRAFLTTGVPTDAVKACWRHNLATAVICEKLARFLQIEADLCYTAGLLHDIGRLALIRACPDQYQHIFSIDPDGGFNLLEIEKSLFEIDHCEAGRVILEQWEFPKELRDVVSTHHHEPNAESSNLARIVYAGWQIADLLGFSALNRPIAGKIEAIASVLPANARQKLLEEFNGLAEDVAFKINAIECSLI
jgi:putative nucleotidyltransferase with HDIG domain